MNANTHNQTELSLIVTRDGEPDQDYARMKQIERVQGVFSSVANTISTNVVCAALALKEAVSIAVYDQMHGTDYGAQLKQQYDQERNARFTGRIGLK